MDTIDLQQTPPPADMHDGLPDGLMTDAVAMSEDLIQLRRTLHREPETGLHLPRTQERVLEALDGLPLEVTTGNATTSVTAVLRGGNPGPTVLLRADMDALPVVEKLAIEFKSTNGAMHACGHDLHTAMLVGAAQLLSPRREQLAGNVLFMFQPGEEGHNGADVMLGEGVLEATGEPPTAAYALHVTSSFLPAGTFASRTGAVMAAAARLLVTVVGAGGHGSAPHRALDPVPAMCEMVTALQTFVTRSFDVFDPVVLTVGSIHAGTASNVIPESGTFEATIRSFSEASNAKVLDECLRVVRGIAAAHGLSVEAVAEPLFPLTVNDDGEAVRVRECVTETFGGRRWMDLPNPLTGSEDFSHVLQRVPGAMVFLGTHVPGADPRTAPYNHSPHAAFDDGFLADGAALYSKLALAHLVGTQG
ncbi:M20 family metallopeptidase [Micromonospora sp. NPDC050495]|uniref:M20 metallopeptidase family protein n=1 Tax=Micromonospora sp. NPDC050495 TaxID=3154936 RepID=UPI0033CB9185